MILYNVTVKIANEIHDDWLEWMRSVQVPDVMATGCFSENKIMCLINPPADEQGVTYAFQYSCENMNVLQDYRERFAPALQADHTERYEGKFVAFLTVLRVV